jgi:hypothetical protein
MCMHVLFRFVLAPGFTHMSEGERERERERYRERERGRGRRRGSERWRGKFDIVQGEGRTTFSTEERFTSVSTWWTRNHRTFPRKQHFQDATRM